MRDLAQIILIAIGISLLSVDDLLVRMIGTMMLFTGLEWRYLWDTER